MSVGIILDELLHYLVPILVTLLELVGVFIIAFGSLKSLFIFIKTKFDVEDEDLKLGLAQSLALALEFKMGAEILKSIIVKTPEELLILGAIVVLRVMLTFVIHWEIKTTHEDKKAQLNDIKIETAKVELEHKKVELKEEMESNDKE